MFQQCSGFYAIKDHSFPCLVGQYLQFLAPLLPFFFLFICFEVETHVIDFNASTIITTKYLFLRSILILYVSTMQGLTYHFYLA